ncbi:CDP-6-deoxy-L-threo-D-glycero-4-hexulose-3-dehydrase reductase [Pigmentiphaga humi]|uniref:CDP-6-deoxy-L-threo-D-glycero-4-hexulose-3-dehydrase reductase n=1 Tax=Pigmentiphaga humi TaxID=2478468 RepID=A0A3P4B1R7_9BURK|nr:CDP-6-deoxy-delta-3,4-glucoseen reductase [Pigmentiphaga humi]VCU69085.1 CDP-6-deoxy-L-threo-D-glycero-4-hexulose-3-dehydrase reductase [Pigmentiphaga humi]
MSHQVTVLPSGHQFSVQEGQTVLDAALHAGVMLPYSCKNGACSSCKGRLVEGSVELGPHQAQTLTPEEIEAGLTLFCVARPQTDLTIEAREVAGIGDIPIRKMPCRVQSITEAAPDVRILRLQLPATEQLRFNAGQYVEIIMKDGRRRSYSMANAPHEEGSLVLHVRHLPGGAFTDHVFGAGATRLKERDILRFEGPFGSFFLREDSHKPIVMVASGTGFAPIRAMVEHMIRQDIRRPVRLYWGGRRPRDLYLDEAALAWAGSVPDFHYVPVVSDALPEDAWSGRTGFVHRAVMEDLPDLSGYQVYACGAPIVVESAQRDFVQHCGLPEDEFYADSFTSEADIARNTV